MFTLDPLKLLILAVVALVVLGPDKLPALARRAGSLLSDLERLRASIREQARTAVDRGPLADEVGDVRQAMEVLRRVRDRPDVRQALSRAVGLDADGVARAHGRPSTADVVWQPAPFEAPEATAEATAEAN